MMTEKKAKSQSKRSFRVSIAKKVVKKVGKASKPGSPSKVSMTTTKKTRSAKQPVSSKSSTAKSKAAPRSMSSVDPLEPAAGKVASMLINQRISELTGWRGQSLARMRSLILDADPEMIEEWKWRGTPVWSHDGIVCTGESYAKVIKLTFAKGASLPDPTHLFNSSLEGNTRRAIDIHEGEEIDATEFKSLIKAAVTLNGQAKIKKTPATKKVVKLLSGGNPQMAKADGDAPVQVYIAAMPGWKREVGTRLDELIERTIPNVAKAIKWNTPFYGVEGEGWFVGFHTFTRYVKVAFFRGSSLRPLPPGESKSKETRYLDIHETDQFDEAQLASWIKQAAALPGFLGKPS